MSNVSTPIPIHRQIDSHRGDSYSQDIRTRQSSTSVSPATSSRGLATSPLDSRPRSYSTGEKYSHSSSQGMHSHTQLRATGNTAAVGGMRGQNEKYPIAQKRLSLDSRLQYKSSSSSSGIGVNAMVGDILNVDNIFNILHLGDKSSSATISGSFVQKKSSSVSKSKVIILMLLVML